MIPFFFTTYKKAPLATVISFLASMCFVGTLFLTVGYFLNWSGVKDEMTLGESLFFAGVLAVIGFLMKKLAEALAKHKQKKLAEKAAAAQPAAGFTPPPVVEPTRSAPPPAAEPVRSAPNPAAQPRAARRFCPMCGTATQEGDLFCVQCGHKL